MRKIVIILCVLQVLIYACNNKDFLIKNNNAKFSEYKSEFASSFINQFPDTIKYPNTNVISNTNRKKNDIGLLLYEYGVDKNEINNIKKNIIDVAIAKYKSDEACLLIVNCFETEESYSNFTMVEAIDSLEIEKSCKEKLYPIPNFIGSNYSKNKNGLKLDESFDIYVLEAKAGNHFEEFKLQPSPQMPNKWKNGYSKGIAISLKNESVIYWSIIW